jgi:hypothetical protein
MSFDMIPTPKLPEPAGNPPLDPTVKAKLRRDAGDEQQLAWDASLDPAEMLRALAVYHRDPAVLLPPAKMIEVASRLFRERGRSVDPLIWTQTMRTAALQVTRGNFAGASLWLRHAVTGAGLARDPDAAYQMMADMVREFFPEAPGSFGAIRVNGRVYPPSIMQAEMRKLMMKREEER